jgi:hypothetical protein
MSSFIYVVTEGVHDVAFLGRLLVVAHAAARIEKLEDLDETKRAWLAKFTWPSARSAHHDIARLSVPAPVFYRLPSRSVVAFRNAQGITEIEKTLTVDLEVFARNRSAPDVIAVVLDSDDELPDVRFAKLKQMLGRLSLVGPSTNGSVTQAIPKVGAFAFPEPGVRGTLEDLILALGDAAYPELAAAGRAHATQWRTQADSEPTNADWKELRKPAGAKKATIGAMTAVLKPGKSLQPSLEDNRWVDANTLTLAALRPCLAFLNDLLQG